MKRITTLLVSVFGILSISTGLVFASSNSDIIQALIKHKIAKEKSVVGVSIAIIENDKVEYINIGLVNQQEKLPVTSDSLFEIGSISKTFTSIALANMVIEGKVKLDDPVKNYLPKSIKMPSKKGKEITLASLANHSSGLPRLPSNMPYSDPLDPYADYSVELMYEFLNGYEPTRDVGEKFEYSNLGVGLLGHVLGLIDRKSYQQVVTDRVLKPMAMQNTFVDVPQSYLKFLSDGHDSQGKPTKHWQLSTLAGAGAIKSNIKDMATYLRGNIDQNLLDRSLKLTLKQSINFGDKNPKIGLAWILAEHKTGSYWWHNGGTGGFRSFIGFDPQMKKGIVILENTANGMDAIGSAYMMGTLTKLRSDILDVVQVDEAKLKSLNGHYQLAPNFIMTVTNEEKQLYVQATGQVRVPMAAKSNLEFVNPKIQARITFELDSKGQALALVLHQRGIEQRAIKMPFSNNENNSPESKDRNEDKIMVVLTKQQLDNLVGEYQLMPNFVITTTRESDQLVIQATGQQKIVFETISKSEFFNEQVQAKLVFRLDVSGRATSLTLFQAGQELKGEKSN